MAARDTGRRRVLQREVGRFHRAEVGDGTLRHLEGLTQLRALTMDYSGVGDAGLQHLEGLTQLRDFLLGFTQISDAGLVHLKGLTRLEVLEVTGPRSATPGCNTSRD